MQNIRNEQREAKKQGEIKGRVHKNSLIKAL